MGNTVRLHTKFHRASLIIKRSNERHTPVRIRRKAAYEVPKDSKIKNIDLNNIFFGGFSKYTPGAYCQEASQKV